MAPTTPNEKRQKYKIRDSELYDLYLDNYAKESRTANKESFMSSDDLGLPASGTILPSGAMDNIAQEHTSDQRDDRKGTLRTSKNIVHDSEPKTDQISAKQSLKASKKTTSEQSIKTELTGDVKATSLQVTDEDEFADGTVAGCGHTTFESDKIADDKEKAPREQMQASRNSPYSDRGLDYMF